MAVFEYKAIDGRGRSSRGIVDADSVRLAGQKLRGQGLYPSVIKQVKSSPRQGRGDVRGRRFSLSRISRSQLASSIRQLSTLLGAGLPLVTSINGVVKQMKPGPLRLVLTQIKERVNEGSSLSDALEEHGSVFPPTFSALVRAGETSGTLELVMEQLADFEERKLALIRKIQTSLAYPVLMLVTGLAVVFFLLTYVIPKVTQIFLDYGQILPRPTIILIAISSFLQQYWPILFGGGLVFVLLVRFYVRTTTGRVRFHAFILRVPVVGPILHHAAISRFARTFATLLKNDVSLLTALNVVRNVVDNEVMATAIDASRKEISEGESIAAPLSRKGIFPETVIQMIAAGEQSGHLDAMLFKVAETSEMEVSTRLGVATSLLEPIMILGLGMIVGFVVLAVLLPIFEMSHLIR
ncbi:type II secretion system inner membrane protein GspF [Desulfoplanes formicivorans]|nr:type II secretion system inner membrane protein GspF [Desulfoplanes formicivorans]